MKPMQKVESRLTRICAALIALTLLSYAASESSQVSSSFTIASVVAAAFVKVRFVVLDFMEVRHAPFALRILIEAWIAILAGVLIFLLSRSSP
jgi:heme/copper-type cytochrome/quinol oxidase subunit 4